MTTAETILLEQQSIAQFVEKLRDTNTHVVVTLSNQSLASLSQKMGIEPGILTRKLCGTLKTRGARSIFDLSVASKIALLENYVEFERRVCYGENLPMLTSSCPGWICYVEKSQPQLLPYISLVKSPQAIMGTLIKQFWSTVNCEGPKNIFHVTVMPCYDKKLESVREELSHAAIPETDCVLTTSELEKWIMDNDIDLTQELEVEPDVLFPNSGAGCGEEIRENGHSGFRGHDIIFGNSDSIESDGYISYMFRRICLREGVEVLNNHIPLNHGRNTDIRECALRLHDGHELQFAIYNGFRNIQGLVRKIKSNKCNYDYVEVMACPSGCLNGGGQLPVDPKTKGDAMDWMRKALKFLSTYNLGHSNAYRQCLLVYRIWIRDSPGSQNASLRFSTTYKQRKLQAATSLVDW